MFCSASVYFIRLCILILCTSYFSDAGSVTWIDNIPGNTTRYRRQAAIEDCKFKFRCGSGECINEDLQCDGKENCKDGSDENDCKDISCPHRNFFKCNYGACISKQLVCDGKPDCKDNSDETTPECSKIAKPVTKAPSSICSTAQFQCDSGQCIDDSLSCDGIANCADNSDETENRCSEFKCPRTTYRCHYGACVNKKARCNNIVECYDGSDEQGCPNTPTKPVEPLPPTPIIPTPTGPAEPGSCVMPNNPAKGVYTIGNTAPGTFKPGNSVTAFSPLRIICNKNYKTTPPDKLVALCVNAKWTPELPKCSPSCLGINSTKTTKVSCTFQGRLLDSCMDPVEETRAKLECESLHEEPSLKQYPFRVCRDGSWDRPFPQCYPVCGIKRPKGITNIVGGKDAVMGDYPWHVGIYNAVDKRHLCGGSILNERVILSAAHCFTDLSTGITYPKENYLIAAGKYYRIYGDPRDNKFEQQSTVKDIHIPQRYRGDVSQYEGDLAVVVVKIKFVFSAAVQPVCVDWRTESEYQQTSGNNFGIVVGWGQTVEGSEPAEKLKELSIPVISYDQCYEQVPKSFRRFLTHDKVCAGFLGNATAACQGDSGGGLTFPDNNDRYYIRGIVSTSPSTVDGNCNSDQYATYTLVSKYIDFINQNGL